MVTKNVEEIELNINLTRVVVIGAGFAGLEAAKILSKDPRIHLTMIDRNNYHLFQPLLYQVATAGLSPAEIAMPIRAVLRGRRDTLVKMAAVTAINQKERLVALDNDSDVKFDYLVGVVLRHFPKRNTDNYKV